MITKHAGTGSAVTVDTVTAQLVYEIQSTRYLGPAVTVHLDAVRLEGVGDDRVAIGDVTAEAPPEQLELCVNELGGWRNGVELVLTGLAVEAKGAWVREQVDSRLAAARVVWSDVTEPPADAPTEESASTLLRCTVKDPSPDPGGRAFTSAFVELALGSYPDFTMTAPPAPATPFGVYRAAYVDRAEVTHTVVRADGTPEVVAGELLLRAGRRPVRRRADRAGRPRLRHRGAIARPSGGVRPRPSDVRPAADRQPVGPAHAGRDASPGRGRAHLHAPRRRPPRGRGVRRRRGVPGQADRGGLRGVRLRPCGSSLPPPATCTAPRWRSGTTARLLPIGGGAEVLRDLTAKPMGHAS